MAEEAHAHYSNWRSPLPRIGNAPNASGRREGYSLEDGSHSGEGGCLVREGTLEFEPGTEWLYSDTGFATLGRIIEVISGQSYESFIQNRLLQPLQMKDTFFYPPSDKLDRIAIVYAPKDGKLIRAGSQILGCDPGAFRKGEISGT